MTSLRKFNVCEELFQNNLKSTNYAVLVLNSVVDWNNVFFMELWNNANIRVLVDGGANTWNFWKETLSPDDKHEILLPQLITGDFDSIDPILLEKFRQNEEIQVLHTPDQNATDFTKSLTALKNFQSNSRIKITDIYVLTSISGRLDHVMANLNTLFLVDSILPDTSVFLLSFESISWLLRPGKYSINIPNVLRDNEEWCGLIPIGSPASVSTQGLKWNLDGTEMKFGKVVSTSNTYDGSPEVLIETNSHILWTMSTKGLLPTSL